MALLMMTAVRISDVTTNVRFVQLIISSGSFTYIWKMAYLRKSGRSDWAGFWEYET
jgi:hypothetical protein